MAAFSVMCYHFVGVFAEIAPAAQNFATRLVLNGDLDVAVFFVLSGDALSASYWNTRSQRGVVKLALKRYFRLTIPVLASCIFMYLLLRFGLVFIHQAAPALHYAAWVARVLQWPYDLKGVFLFGLIDVYIRHTEASSLNPPLWTMGIEMIGSILVFLILLCERSVKRITWVLLFLGLLLLVGRSWLACFVLGMLLGDMRSKGVFTALRSSTLSSGFIPTAFLVLLAASWLPLRGPDLTAGFSILAVCLVFCIFANSTLSKFFRNSVSRWLGEISFPLYVIHFPVLASFTSGMIILADGSGHLNGWMIGAILLASIGVSVALAVAFGPVEKLTRAVGNLVCRVVEG